MIAMTETKTDPCAQPDLRNEAGLRAAAVELARLADDPELRARGISFNDEGAYRPHITLARQCEILPLPGGTVNYRQRVRAVTLFESARREGELRYTPLEKAALRA